MILSKIADEIDLLARADRWLAHSLASPSTWSKPEDGECYVADVRRSQQSALAARFPGGEIQAEALALSLAFELRRLSDSPRMMRFALERGTWPEVMRAEARVIVSGFEGLAS